MLRLLKRTLLCHSVMKALVLSSAYFHLLRIHLDLGPVRVASVLNSCLVLNPPTDEKVSVEN